MAYSVEYNSTDEIIIANITGKINVFDLREVLLIIIQLAKQRKCFRVLTDLREAKLNASVVEMYDLPREISEIVKENDLEFHAIKRAFVAPKDTAHLDFYETVSRNRSHNVRLFYDLEEAKAWMRDT